MTLQRKEQFKVTTILLHLEKKTLSHHSKQESNNQHHHTRIIHYSPNTPWEVETEGFMLGMEADEEDMVQEEDQFRFQNA